MSDYYFIYGARCEKCWGELDTGYKCMSCGADNQPKYKTTFSNDTVIRDGDTVTVDWQINEEW